MREREGKRAPYRQAGSLAVTEWVEERRERNHPWGSYWGSLEPQFHLPATMST